MGEILFGDARNRSENSQLYGEKGYMATITSAVEHNFLTSAWTTYIYHAILLLGASDVEEAGKEGRERRD